MKSALLAVFHTKLFRVRCVEPVQKRPVVQADRVDDERIAFVTADGFAVSGCLHPLGMLVRQVDAANLVEARQYHRHFLRSLNDI
jgi:hypothetical protein